MSSTASRPHPALLSFPTRRSSDLNGQCFGPSSNWADWPLVINSQDAQSVDWTLPAGVGQHFVGGELVMLQTHYVNATTQKSPVRSEEHTSELQSLRHLVCRLLLEK